MNKNIISEFEKLVKQIQFKIDNTSSKKDNMANYYRLKQIKSALEIIKKYPNEIKKGEDLEDIKGIGKGTISRINEIIDTGKLSEIETDKKEEEIVNHIEELIQIIGIDRKTAYKLITKNKIKTIEQLKQAYRDGKIELTHSIVMGLKYHGVYKEDIPRAEIDEVNKFLQKVIIDIDPNLRLVICGSYRRLKPKSGDIDILLTHNKIKTRKDMEKKPNPLIKLVETLKTEEFIVDDLTDKDFKEKYMGFSKLKKGKKVYPVRRIDIRYLPNESYYSGLLYFTGSGGFNEKMRRIAIDQGYMLNEYGLYKVDEEGEKTRIPIKSEKDIFEELGMEYLPPEKR